LRTRGPNVSWNGARPGATRLGLKCPAPARSCERHQKPSSQVLARNGRRAAGRSRSVESPAVWRPHVQRAAEEASVVGEVLDTNVPDPTRLSSNSANSWSSTQDRNARDLELGRESAGGGQALTPARRRAAMASRYRRRSAGRGAWPPSGRWRWRAGCRGRCSSRATSIVVISIRYKWLLLTTTRPSRIPVDRCRRPDSTTFRRRRRHVTVTGK
jgi:hypothetical protein